MGTDADVSVDPRSRHDSAVRILNRFLALCEAPRTRDRMLALVRSAVDHEGSGTRFYARFNAAVVSPVMWQGLRDRTLRSELVASQLVGLAMMRYVLEVEPVCSLPRDRVVDLMAPAIRATLRAGDAESA